jgi:lipase chaperone LimK
MFLDENFKEFDNKKDLFENVQKYLSSIMPADMADKLFDLYKKFVDYQLTLGEKTKDWGGMPKTTEEAVDFLHKIQDYRREFFGKEVADILFGASVKAEEYPLRRGAILGDKNMYGAEKEKKLKQLNEDMWGDEADKVDAYAEPYTKYKEKLAMYEKDLSEMNEEGKKAQIRTFREEIFTKDQVQSLENVDRAIADNEKKEADYKASESEIINDSSLNKAEKENKVQELQNQMYGDEADALRRRLAIERASEAVLKK